MTTPDLTNITEAALKAELERRAAIKKAEAEQKRKVHDWAVIEHITALLKVRPAHDRTSCSDDNPRNDNACIRCGLLWIKRNNQIPERWEVQVHIAYRLDMPEHAHCACER